MSHHLTSEELEGYHNNGFVGPFRLLDEADASDLLTKIEQDVFSTAGPLPGHDTFMRHMDSPLIYDVCADASVTDRISSILGPDLMLWNTSFWRKEPGDSEIPMHQDMHYWPNDPPTNISMWLALTKSTRDNACLRLIPGSHKRILSHIDSSDGALFATGADPAQFDMADAIPMEMQPGQFVLFNDRLLHGSPANTSTERRIGFVARYTYPSTKLYLDQIPLFPAHRAIIVRGEDRFEFNQCKPPPQATQQE